MMFGDIIFNSAVDEGVASVSDNLMLVLIVLGISILLLAVIRTVDVIDGYRQRVKLDDLDQRKEKLVNYAKVQKRRALRDAMTSLRPEERKHLYSIWEDNAVVSRKALYRLNELEERTRRAERGAEKRWAEGKLGELKETEREIFPEAFGRAK